MLSRFQNQIRGYAIVEAQFETIIAFKSNVSEHIDLEELFDILDNDHDGRIDGLEFLGGLALCCNASFEDKARFCYELFDFNLNSLLSKKELAMMMISSICGMNILMGGGEDLEPSIDEIDQLAEEALHRADKNGDGQISYEEFVVWARSNRDLMAFLETLSRIAAVAKEEVQSDDSAPETENDGDSVFGDELDVDTLDRLAEFSDERRGLEKKSLPTRSSSIHTASDGHPLMASLIEPLEAHRGDQALAVVPWRGQILEPTNYKKRKGDDDGPTTNLSLAWAFGARAKGPNFVRYLMHGDSGDRLIVYAAAALCVIFDCNTRQQNFYLGHSVEITAMTVHSNNLIVATADRASTIHIWTLDKNKRPQSLLAINKSLVRSGIQNLAFSPSGDRIAAVGMDPDHTLCIYSASKGDLISSSKGMSSPNDVIDLAYSPNGSELVLAGKNLIKFFVGVNTNVRAINSKIGRIGSKGKRQVFCSAAYLKDTDAVIGTAGGEIYRFNNGECVAIIQAHGVKEPVLCLFFNNLTGNLLSGGKDANIKTWDSTLKEIGGAIDLSEDANGDGNADSGSLNPAVLSIHQLGDKLLIGTVGCDIFEAVLPTNPTLAPILERIAWGHGSGELWGLATHPTRDEFVTVGDDKTVRIWSLRSKEQVNVRLMPEAARAVAYHPAGSVICIGAIDGAVSLMDASQASLRVYQTWKHCSKMINDIKFSNDGTLLAVGSADTNIYLYKSDDKINFRRQAVCRGHSGAVTHLDFSANSQYLQSNANDCALLYWDTTGNQVKHGSSMRDVLWATFTCTFGWPVQGVWSPSSDFTDVNACMALPDVGDIVTGDDDGKVKLYRYPALRHDAIYQSYVGHASHVTNVRFSWNRRHLLSSGGRDRAILLWKHEIEQHDSDHEDAGQGYQSSGSSSAVSADSATESKSVRLQTRKLHPAAVPRTVQQEAANLGWSLQDMEEFVSHKRRTKAQQKGILKGGAALKGADALLLQGPRLGDQSALPEEVGIEQQVAPWKACVAEPSSFTPCGQATDVDLTLLWVHGHRSRDCRNNVFYSAEGSVVYNAANLAIVYHKPSGRQNFLHGPHIDEVLSIAMHPAGQIFATGEAGRRASIIVWNSTSMHVLSRLEGVHQAGVSLLAFNSSGDTLASVGLDDLNTLSIYNWQKNIQILCTNTSKSKILCACFLAANQNVELSKSNTGGSAFASANGRKISAPASSDANSIPKDQDILVTGGSKFLKFWWWQGQNVQSQSAIWTGHKKERKELLLSLTSASPGICVTGSSSGSLLVWKDFKIACNTRRYYEAMANMHQLEPHSRRNEESTKEELGPGEHSFYPKGGYPHVSAILALCGIPGSIDHVDDLDDVCHTGLDTACRYISGDQDGTICIWRLVTTASSTGLRLVLVKRAALHMITSPGLHGRSIKSIAERDGLLLIGTSASEIVEIAEDQLQFIDAYEGYSSTQPTADIPAQQDLRGQLLGSGHGAGEIWGLAMHPSLPIFFTTGDDATLRCWNLQTHQLISYAFLGDKSRAIDISVQDRAEEIAVALNDGSVAVVDLCAFLNPDSVPRTQLDPYLSERDVSTLVGLSSPAFSNFEDEEIFDNQDGEDADEAHAVNEDDLKTNKPKKDAKPKSDKLGKLPDVGTGRYLKDLIEEPGRKPVEWVQVLRYSPEGSLLAAGAHDHVIYVYDMLNPQSRNTTISAKPYFPLLYKFAEHRDFVTHMDFGVYLRLREPIAVTGGILEKDGIRTVTERFVTDEYEQTRCKIITYITEVVTVIRLANQEVLSRETRTSPPPISSNAGSNAQQQAAKKQQKSGSSVSTTLEPALQRDVKREDLRVQSTSACGDLLFWAFGSNDNAVATSANALEVQRAVQILSLQSIKDVRWVTQTCPYGWAVQGAWADDLQRNDLLAVDRSHCFEKVPVLVVADVVGRLRLFSHPCTLPNAPDKCYRGHTNKVTNARFSHDDNFVVSTGGPDQCVFVWATDVSDELRQRSVYLAHANTSHSNNAIVNTIAPVSIEAGPKEGLALEEDLQPLLRPTAGDESLYKNISSVFQPQKQVLYSEPTTHHKGLALQYEAPELSLDLRHVYGYRGWDVRNNLCFADSRQEIVYHIAGIGIVLNTATNTQILQHSAHENDILCVATHPEGHTVATGELGRFPQIVIWDANTGITIRTLRGHKQGVNLLAFSGDGAMLVSCGLDADHSILVHSVASGALLGRGKCGRAPLQLHCLAVSQAGVFVTGGRDFVKFWNLPLMSSSGGELSSKTGIFAAKKTSQQTAVSCAFLGLDAVTGMSDGTLCLWKERSNTKAIEKAHKGAITAMTSVGSITAVASGGGGGGAAGGAGGAGAGGSGGAGSSSDGSGAGGDGSLGVTPRFLLTGGADGCVHLWDIQFILLWSLDMTQTTPRSLLPAVQALASREGRVVIGTKAGEIYEVSLSGSLDCVRHVEGHYGSRAEVWGLDVHPKGPLFVTGADDETVRLWDYKTRRPITTVSTQTSCRAVAFHPDGSQLAVTHGDGHLQVLRCDLSAELAKVTATSSWSAALAYSPDGALVAIGCRGDDADATVVCLFETKSWSCRAKCRGHKTGVSHLDFSVDGVYLRSASANVSLGCELLHWRTADGKIVSNPAEVRDVVWATTRCVLSWETQGIWEGCDTTHAPASTVPSSSSTGAAGAVSGPSRRLALATSSEVATCVDRCGDYMVVGGESRLLKLFRFPAVDSTAAFKAYKGHVDTLRRVRFSPDGTTVFSVGGLDKAILQFDVKTKK